MYPLKDKLIIKMCDIKLMKYVSAVNKYEIMDLFEGSHTYHRVFVDISKQLAGVSLLFLPCGLLGLKVGYKLGKPLHLLSRVAGPTSLLK